MKTSSEKYPAKQQWRSSDVSGSPFLCDVKSILTTAHNKLASIVAFTKAHLLPFGPCQPFHLTRWARVVCVCLCVASKLVMCSLESIHDFDPTPAIVSSIPIPSKPLVVRSRLESSRVVRSRPESSGVVRSRLVSSGVVRSRPESTKVDRSRQKSESFVVGRS